MEVLDKVMSHIPERTKRDDARFNRSTQDGVQFKTYELFAYGIFHLIFLDHD